MNCRVPVIIVRDERGFAAQSLFGLDEPVLARGPTLQNAQSRFEGQLRRLLREPEGAQHPALLLADAELEPRYVRGRLDLRGDKARPFRLLVIEQPHGDGVIAHVPRLGFAFHRDLALGLAEDTATVVARVLYQRRKANQEVPRVLDDGRSSIWLTRLDVALDPANSQRRDTSDLVRLFMTGIGTGAEELRKTSRCLDDLDPQRELRCRFREAELERLGQRLRAKARPGVLLLGEAGVGKSAVVRELAMRAAERRRVGREDRAPGAFWHLTPARLIAGMMYQGQWEQRLDAILSHAQSQDLVLWFDDLLGLCSAGRASGTNLVMADVIKAAIESGRCRILGEATPGAFRVLAEQHRALASAFEIVRLRELETDEVRRLVLHAARHLERQNRVLFAPGVLTGVSQLTARAPGGRVEPGRSLDKLGQLVRRAAARDGDPRAVIRTEDMEREIVLPRLHRWGGLLEVLNHRLRGQPRATAVLAEVARRAHFGLQDPRRPIYSLLLVGPTGVGKTQSAKLLTKMLFGEPRFLLRFDMNQYGSYDQAQQLIGTFAAPDGHLTAAVRRTPAGVVLFDEIEKAHPVVFDLLLQLLDDGRLTDARGETVDFRQSIFVMTSNLGAVEAGNRIGPGGGEAVEVYLAAVRRFFRPELFNRIDRIVPFDVLSRVEIEYLVGDEIARIGARHGLRRRDVLLQCSARAHRRLAELSCRHAQGARALQRMLRDEVLARLAPQLAGVTGRGFLAAIYCVDGEIRTHLHRLRRCGVPAGHAPSVAPEPAAGDPARSTEALLDRLLRVERRIAERHRSGEWTPAMCEEFTRLLIEPLACELDDLQTSREQDVTRARSSKPQWERGSPRRERLGSLGDAEIEAYMEQREAPIAWPQARIANLQQRLTEVERRSQLPWPGQQIVYLHPLCAERSIGWEQSCMEQVLSFGASLDLVVAPCELVPIDPGFCADVDAVALVVEGLLGEFLAWLQGGELDLNHCVWAELRVEPLRPGMSPAAQVAQRRAERQAAVDAIESGRVPIDRLEPGPVAAIFRPEGALDVPVDRPWTAPVPRQRDDIAVLWQRFCCGEPGTGVTSSARPEDPQ